MNAYIKWKIEQIGGRILSTFIKIDKKRILLLSVDYSGSNAVALYKLAPDYIKSKYSVKHLLYPPSGTGTKKKLAFFLELAKSKIIIGTHGARKYRKQQIAIELWHGVPLKRLILTESNLGKEHKKRAVTAMQETDYVLSCSETYSTLLGACKCVDGNKFVVLGYPRNDFLFRKNSKKILIDLLGENVENKKLMFVVPTFRKGFVNQYLEKEEGKKSWNNIFGFEMFDSRRFNSFLSRNNLAVILKIHPFEEKWVMTNLNKFNNPNIYLLPNELLIDKNTDFYEILGAADILVTDYSSVYYDFLLLDKPIIFTTVDIKQYKKDRGFLLEPYDFWAPGPKCVDQTSLERETEKLLSDKYYFSSERNQIKEIIFRYKDGNSSQRVWGFIDRIMQKK